jgi:FkbM family methyltransferase
MDLKTAFKRVVMGLGGSTCTIGKYSLKLDTHEGIQRAIYIGCFELTETRWFHDILKPDMVVMDIGANVGYYSFLASSLVGDRGLVYAFEPSNRAYDTLLHNVEKNQISNIVPCNFAIGNKEEVLELFSADGIPTNIYNIHSPSFLWRSDQHYLKENGIGVNMGFKQIVPLDTFCTKNNVSHIDFIKIDVEGFELQVLQGMKPMLEKRKISWIMIEYQEIKKLFTPNSESELMDAMLRSYGFELANSVVYPESQGVVVGNFLYKLQEA